ncbi:hypothetical protein GT039_41560, partial [Streptomyces sp. SID2955]|nr:hypothetical protein [Streptomyces sp. SID2955]
MWRTPLGDEGRGIAESDARHRVSRRNAMYEYELHRFRSAELRRTAQRERLAREA